MGIANLKPNSSPLFVGGWPVWPPQMVSGREMLRNRLILDVVESLTRFPGQHAVGKEATGTYGYSSQSHQYIFQEI